MKQKQLEIAQIGHQRAWNCHRAQNGHQMVWNSGVSEMAIEIENNLDHILSLINMRNKL